MNMPPKLLLYLALALFLTAVAPLSRAEIVMELDRADGVYAQGETASVTIRHTFDTTPENWTATIEVRKNHSEMMGQQTWNLAAEPQPLALSLDEPGQLIVTAAVHVEGQRRPVHSKSIGMLFEPERIELSTEEPGDFDAFWADQLEWMRARVGEQALTPMDSEQPGIELFDLQIAIDEEKPVSGLLAYPKEAAKGTLPAVLSVHGAGTYRANRRIARELASVGFLTLDINPHGLPNDKPGAYYNEVRQNELRLYRGRGIDSRETFYFRTMFLRVAAALDYLAAHPLWNGEVLLIRGSSQGGAQAIAGAALDPCVTGLAVNVPAMCDLSARAVGRRPGWPNPPLFVRANELDPEAVAQTVRYYDMGIFARRIEAPALVIAGLIDTACPAAGIQAMVNNLQGPVTFHRYPDMGHDAPRKVVDAIEAFLIEHGGLNN